MMHGKSERGVEKGDGPEESDLICYGGRKGEEECVARHSCLSCSGLSGLSFSLLPLFILGPAAPVSSSEAINQQ
jgi:hypothetical protein